jgi:branched-chain amino acid transport system permease protein
VALAIALPFIFNDEYIRYLLNLFVIYAIFALSLDIIMGYMGQYSFGHQVALGLGAYTVGFLSVTWKLSPSPWLSLLAGVAVATVFGFIIGFVALRATRGVYLAIITFGIGVIMTTLVYTAYKITGGSRGIALIPPLSIGGLTFNTDITSYLLELFFLGLTVYLIHRWLNSRFGRAVVAVRENEDLAKSTGINSYRYYVMAFTLASALAGLSGCLFAFYLRAITPALFGTDYMIMALIMVVVGGTRSLGGPILGSAIYVFGLRLIPFAKETVLVIFGAIVLFCILFLQRGVYPWLETILTRLTEWRRPGETSGGEASQQT